MMRAEREIAVRAAVAFAMIALLAAMAHLLPSIFALAPLHNGMPPFSESPEFIWTFRGIDLIVQGTIVLAATIAISAMFREPAKQLPEECAPEEAGSDEPFEEEDL